MKRIKNYDLIKLIGHGHSAEVHMAIDMDTGQQVAIKLLHDYLTDDHNKQSFLHEASFMAKLNHPAIIKMIAVDSMYRVPTLCSHTLLMATCACNIHIIVS